MMRASRSFLLFVFCLVAASPAAGQVSAEARAGGSIGNHLPAESGLETQPGGSFSGLLEARLAPGVSAYGVYSRASFGCEEGFCAGRDITFATSGFGGGLRLHPARLPWLRAGLVHYGTRVHTSGEGRERVDAAPGYELGTGFTLPLTPGVRLLPGATYRTHFGGAERTTVLSLDLGLQLRLAPRGRVRP